MPGMRIEVIEPATEQVMESVPRAGPRRWTPRSPPQAAFPAWRAVAPRGPLGAAPPPLRRVNERLEDLATLEARNAGKPIANARGEIGMVAECFRYYAGGAGAPDSGRPSRSPAAST